MAALFTPRSNLVARIVVALVILLIVGGSYAYYALLNSSYNTGVGFFVEQTIPFSHKHHVGDDGLDCRYCHDTVEDGPFAGIPATDTCMNCHWQIWTEAPVLAPLRESWRTGRPLRWHRVHKLPDYVYFDHSIHIHKGIGCVTCHGRVDEMPLTYKAQTLYMNWCLDCHRDPSRYIRPRGEVFNLTWPEPPDRAAFGRRLMEEYDVQIERLTDCVICHR
jgi:hypothetical protein